MHSQIHAALQNKDLSRFWRPSVFNVVKCFLSDLKRAASSYNRKHVAAVLQHGQTWGQSQDSLQETPHHRLACADSHQGPQPAGHTFFHSSNQNGHLKVNDHGSCDFNSTQ